MYRLLTLSTLILLSHCEPRRPRIYNVLISTKKNLSPSHALPVYEPVIRTTSLGVAFPSLLYHSTPLNAEPISLLHGGPVFQEIIKNPTKIEQQIPNQQYSHKQYIPYIQQYYRNIPPNLINPAQSYEYSEPSRRVEEREEPQKHFAKYYENLNDPKQDIANLKTNPEIPDVPPPPLPVRNV